MPILFQKLVRYTPILLFTFLFLTLVGLVVFSVNKNSSTVYAEDGMGVNSAGGGTSENDGSSSSSDGLGCENGITSSSGGFTPPTCPDGSLQPSHQECTGNDVNEVCTTIYDSCPASSCPADAPYAETNTASIQTYCTAVNGAPPAGYTYPSSISCHAAPGWQPYGVACTPPSCSCVYVPILPPEQPAWMTGTCQSPTIAKLDWASVGGATSYDIRYSASSINSAADCMPTWSFSGPHTCYLDAWPWSNTYDIGVVSGIQYDAWVHARGPDGVSGATHVSSLFTCSAQPNLISYAPNFQIVGGNSHLQNTSVSFIATAMNTGTAEAVAPYTDRFYYTTGGAAPWIPIPPDIAGVSLGVFPGGTNGGAKNESATAAFATPGIYSVYHCVEQTNVVAESNEADNCAGPLTLVITAGPSPTVSCSPNPAGPITTGNSVTWTAVGSGGTGALTYYWSGTDGLNGSANPTSITYNTAGTKSAFAAVIDSIGMSSGWQACSTSVTVNNPAPPTTPTADLKVRVSPAAFGDGPLFINSTDNIQLQWSSTNATRCIGTNFTTGAGNPTGNPTPATQNTVTEPGVGLSTTYTVTCDNGSGGSASDSVIVTTNATSGVPTLIVNPDRVRQGQTTVVSGVLNGQTNCSITGTNIGGNGVNSVSSVPASYSYTTGAINGETTFTLSCTSGGTANGTVKLFPTFEEI